MVGGFRRRRLVPAHRPVHKRIEREIGRIEIDRLRRCRLDMGPGAQHIAEPPQSGTADIVDRGVAGDHIAEGRLERRTGQFLCRHGWSRVQQEHEQPDRHRPHRHSAQYSRRNGIPGDQQQGEGEEQGAELDFVTGADDCGLHTSRERCQRTGKGRSRLDRKGTPAGAGGIESGRRIGAGDAGLEPFAQHRGPAGGGRRKRTAPGDRNLQPPRTLLPGTASDSRACAPNHPRQHSGECSGQRQRRPVRCRGGVEQHHLSAAAFCGGDDRGAIPRAAPSSVRRAQHPEPPAAGARRSLPPGAVPALQRDFRPETGGSPAAAPMRMPRQDRGRPG